MNKKKTIRRGGFTGFIVGLLAATASIAGILYMLERNSDRDFKEPELSESTASQTEILTPIVSENTSEPIEQGKLDYSALTDGEVPKTEVKTPEEPSQLIEESSDKPTLAEPSDRENKPESSSKTKSTVKEPQARKPDAEQILNMGNIEKAREQVQREAKRAEQALTQGNHSEKAKPQVAEISKNNQHKAVVQAGAYSKRETAEEQRAKLALLVVDSHIEAVQINGRAIYRVQSAQLSSEQAEKLATELNQNGIATQIRKH